MMVVSKGGRWAYLEFGVAVVVVVALVYSNRDGLSTSAYEWATAMAPLVF
jgi:hypothetical protein